MLIGQGDPDRLLTQAEIRGLAAEALDRAGLEGRRVLVLVPDGTRSAPLGLFFRIFHELLGGRAARLDYLIALGTHQPLGREAVLGRFGLGPDDLERLYPKVRVYNHEWEKPGTFRTVGALAADELGALREVLPPGATVPVSLNRKIFDYDQLIICGPVFPHEVAGFSGGNKYLFPGISGPEVIDATHWLGAMITNWDTIGRKHTPVRAAIDRAAACVEIPKLCFSLVVSGKEDLAGLYIGPPEESWSGAADLSARVHVVYPNRPFQRVLSVIPEMYEDMWTAAKGMYKVEPVVADGGEVILYAPHIRTVSKTHGAVLGEIGYHVRDYFVAQWDRFKHHPWGVLAHSTHLRGLGTFRDGVERPRVRVTLATGIPREVCERLNVGYLDPAGVRPEEWAGRESEGRLLVPRAGEVLYRLRTPEPAS